MSVPSPSISPEALGGWWGSMTREERFVTGGVSAVAALLAVGVLTGALSFRYLVSILAVAGMYILLTLGLNVQWGYCGLVNFSVVAFWGIGAYSAALVTGTRAPYALELHPLAGLAVAILLSALLAVAIGYPTLRLRADYLAIATLGFAEIVRIVILNEAWLTAGGRGVGGIPALFQWVPGLNEVAGTLGVQPRSLANLLVVAFLAAVTFLVLRRIQQSPWGRVLRTIRADEDLAQALGKNTFRFKVQAFVIGSVVMAVAGVYYAHMNRFIIPAELLPMETFYIWIAVILGGSGSNRGAVIGGLFVVLILQGTRFLNEAVDAVFFFADVSVAPLRLFLIGLLVILVMRYRPSGVLPPQREHIWPPALADGTERRDRRPEPGDGGGRRDE